ncbi:hypothetical protein [Carboxylicivirga caseinilyticus]|uniref:hypothetical protein n=1 Tax=Carboxylicivirga caseinilyticus TaxID=3417572 RepID=UPI003D3298AD|nr:hypothetical protein [Marinilabiliaceae bacterium A049]
MYRRDYILRIIEQIAQFIARLLKLQQEEKIDQAYDFLVNHSDRVTGFKYDVFLKMSLEEFEQHLDKNEINDAYLDTLGQYLLISADVCLRLKKDEEAIHQLEMARFCFTEAEQRFQSFSFNRQIEIEKMNQLMLRAGIV